MREILFRGKRKDSDIWLFGDLRQWSETRKGIKEHTLMGTMEVEAESIGQFTGLTDKNEKRIFEGDIVSFDYIGGNRGVNGKAVVDFNNGKFGVFWGWRNEFVSLDGFANTTSEVIGNIHDNPELLEA